jgi:hypothetical protein
MSQRPQFRTELPRPNLNRPNSPSQPLGLMGPQGVTLQLNVQVAMPFKAFIGDPRMIDEVILKMAAEIMDEIKKRGLKF